ncbi:MAG: hypothetical protein CVV48_08080 [Spirochaetae bacterium HGW-Spirochaetae-4]|nr:MAG: hypothetical protein CVV48_08080 [Spirochaetae bacterium HGW-Spirochaetae-4]
MQWYICYHSFVHLEVLFIETTLHRVTRYIRDVNLFSSGQRARTNSNKNFSDGSSNDFFLSGRDSIYGQTVGAEYPATKRITNNSDEIVRSENHHPPIIDKETFDLVQEMKKMRSNIELDVGAFRLQFLHALETAFVDDRRMMVS